MLSRFCVMNTDLTYASKEDFQTDAQIAAAKQNGEVVKHEFQITLVTFSPSNVLFDILRPPNDHLTSRLL